MYVTGGGAYVINGGALNGGVVVASGALFLVLGYILLASPLTVGIGILYIVAGNALIYYNLCATSKGVEKAGEFLNCLYDIDKFDTEEEFLKQTKKTIWSKIQSAMFKTSVIAKGLGFCIKNITTVLKFFKFDSCTKSSGCDAVQF